MSAKDANGNVMRRGDRVNIRNDRSTTGVVVSTAGSAVIVEWDENSDETAESPADLELCNTGMGRRGQ